MNCMGCKTSHSRTPAIRYMKHPETGEDGWFCEKWFKPSKVEFVPDNIREQRNKYKKSMIQRYREGELSREFVEAYPRQVKEMVEEGTVTPSQVKKAKNVWSSELKGWEKTE